MTSRRRTPRSNRRRAGAPTTPSPATKAPREFGPTPESFSTNQQQARSWGKAIASAMETPGRHSVRTRLAVPDAMASKHGLTSAASAAMRERLKKWMLFYVHPDRHPTDENTLWTELTQVLQLLFAFAEKHGLDSEPKMVGDNWVPWGDANDESSDADDAPWSPAHASSPPPAPPAASPATKAAFKKADAVVRLLQRDDLEDDRYFELPRGSGRTGLRFKFPTNIKERWVTLQQILDAASSKPSASAAQLDEWERCRAKLQAAWDRLNEQHKASDRARDEARAEAAAAAAAGKDALELYQSLAKPGERVEFAMSGTHTPTKVNGKTAITDNSVFSGMVGDLLSWWDVQAPRLQEAGFIAPGPNTWGLTRERGEGLGKFHGQGLTRVCAVDYEEAKELLTKIFKCYQSKVPHYYFDHEVHDKGDNRPLKVAFGYVLKDGGGGVRPRRNHFLHVGNISEEAQKEYFQEWFKTINVDSWNFSKMGFVWKGDSNKKVVNLKRSNMIPLTINFVQCEGAMMYDASFLDRLAWFHSVTRAAPARSPEYTSHVSPPPTHTGS